MPLWDQSNLGSNEVDDASTGGSLSLLLLIVTYIKYLHQLKLIELVVRAE